MKLGLNSVPCSFQLDQPFYVLGLLILFLKARTNNLFLLRGTFPKKKKKVTISLLKNETNIF